MRRLWPEDRAAQVMWALVAVALAVAAIIVLATNQSQPTAGYEPPSATGTSRTTTGVPTTVINGTSTSDSTDGVIGVTTTRGITTTVGGTTTVETTITAVTTTTVRLTDTGTATVTTTAGVTTTSTTGITTTETATATETVTETVTTTKTKGGGGGP